MYAMTLWSKNIFTDTLFQLTCDVPSISSLPQGMTVFSLMAENEQEKHVVGFNVASSSSSSYSYSYFFDFNSSVLLVTFGFWFSFVCTTQDFVVSSIGNVECLTLYETIFGLIRTDVHLIHQYGNLKVRCIYALCVCRKNKLIFGPPFGTYMHWFKLFLNGISTLKHVFSDNSQSF